MKLDTGLGECADVGEFDITYYIRFAYYVLRCALYNAYKFVAVNVPTLFFANKMDISGTHSQKLPHEPYYMTYYIYYIYYMTYYMKLTT